MMNVVHSDPMLAPHLLVNRLPSHSDSPNIQSMSGRKRKASEEPSDNERMSTSPSASPSISSRLLPPPITHRSIKRSRTGTAHGKPLPLPRLLQTLSVEQMRALLEEVCEEHPQLQQEIVTRAQRPSVESTLTVLDKYEGEFRSAFPLGNRPTSDYSYNRVRQHLLQLIEALRDFTPHFLPPEETQTTSSLSYLDAVTNVIHRLPDWDTFQNQRHKNDAYDDIGKAWALVIKEAGKRAGGFHLQLGGWDRKLMEHNQKSGGKLDEALSELRMALGYSQADPRPPMTTAVSDERLNIRQQLFSGSYGQNVGVGHGSW